MNPVIMRWVAISAGVLTCAGTLALGRWQLQRADEKLAAAALLQQRSMEPAWRDADWPCAVRASALAAGRMPAAPTAAPTATHGPSSDELPVQRPAQLQGRWLRDRTVFLDNRPMEGRTGFIVLTPLRLSEGPCRGELVLVQRGWAPRDGIDRQKLPTWQDTPAEVRVSGRVAQQPSRTYAVGEEAMPPPGQTRVIRQNVDAAFWSAWLGQAPLAGALLQTDDAHAVDGPEDEPHLLRHWAPPDLGVGKHQAYAAQWFALAALAAGLTLWFQFIRPRQPFRPEPSRP